MARTQLESDKRHALPLIERAKNYNNSRNFKPITENFNSIVSKIEFKDDSLEDEIEKWKKDKNYKLAGEIISHAIVLDKIDDVESVKKFLLKKYPKDDVIKWVFRDSNLDRVNQIDYNKKKLELEPKDAVTWIDQAINYLGINDRDKALESINEAIDINSDQGYIIRSASRVLNILGDTNQSIKLLKNSKFYQYDPQILSAEISFSQLEGRRTKGIEFAQKIFNSKQYENYEKSELLSTIGTIEYFKGNYKKSEKLFDSSLIAPNRNSFAQSLWYKQNKPTTLNLNYLQDSNEILTKQRFNDSLFEDSLFYNLKWIEDEPFNTRAYSRAAHVQGVLLEDYGGAYNHTLSSFDKQKFLQGQNFNLEEELSFNNDLAYFLLKNNKVKKAEKFLEPFMNIIREKSNLKHKEYFNLATLGLYFYKNNEYELGRKLYRRAIKYFVDKGYTYSAKSAFINFLLEEIEVVKDKNEFDKLIIELNYMVRDNDSSNEFLYLKQKVLNNINSRISQLK